MAATKSTTKSATKPATKPARSTADTAVDTFTDEERAAMKERARELKSAGRRRSGGAANTEGEVLAKIAEMAEPDRVLAERIHAVIKENAPGLTAKLWYGMPAYAVDDKVLCFFQSAQKFNSRYATLGFNDVAKLDDGTMWPTSFALTTLTDDEEAKIAALVRRAVG